MKFISQLSQGHFIPICKKLLRHFLIKKRAFFSNLSYNITTYNSIESLVCQIQN